MSSRNTTADDDQLFALQPKRVPIRAAWQHESAGPHTPRKLHPVSRIRVVLEKVRILDDHDPWLKDRGDFQFTTCVAFNHESCRRHYARVPQKGVLKIGE